MIRYILFILFVFCSCQYNGDARNTEQQKKLVRQWETADKKLDLYEGILWRLKEMEDMEQSRLNPEDSAWVLTATQNIQNVQQKERLINALTREYSRSPKEIEYEISELLNRTDIATKTHIESLIISQKLEEECQKIRLQTRPVLMAYYKGKSMGAYYKCPPYLKANLENPYFKVKKFKISLERQGKIIKTGFFEGDVAYLDKWEKLVLPNDNLIIESISAEYKEPDTTVFEIDFVEKCYIHIAELYYEG